MSQTARSRPPRLKPLTEGAVVAHRYVVQRVIGQGGMGQVLEVEHVALGRRSALKTLRLEKWNDELVRRFNREARALAVLTTPRVAQVTDFGVDEEAGPFYVMELLRGLTLEERIQQSGRIPAREALTIVAEICDALAEVHAAGLIHRDLKPSNIGLPDDGPVGVKLLDFGLVAAMDDAFMSRITQSQQILGSLPYMSPEQFNAAPPSTSIDVYGVGIVLYEALVGRLPFLAPSTAALIHLILSTPPPALPPEVAALGPLEALLERLLAKDASQRFASAAAAAQAIRQVCDTMGGPIARRVPAVPTREVRPEEVRAGGGSGPISERTASERPSAKQSDPAVPNTIEAPAGNARAAVGMMPTLMADSDALIHESGMRASKSAPAPALAPPVLDTPASGIDPAAALALAGTFAMTANAIPPQAAHAPQAPYSPSPHPATAPIPAPMHTPAPSYSSTFIATPARPSWALRIAIAAALGLVFAVVSALAVVLVLQAFEDRPDRRSRPSTVAAPAPEPMAPAPETAPSNIAPSDVAPPDEPASAMPEPTPEPAPPIEVEPRPAPEPARARPPAPPPRERPEPPPPTTFEPQPFGSRGSSTPPPSSSRRGSGWNGNRPAEW